MEYGTALRRSIDLARFNCYGELVSELDKIFEFNGALIDGSSNWHLSYTDGEIDKMFLEGILGHSQEDVYLS
ncbi:Auxin response factor 24 [Olea europaea subsp. europaea]|uniref:Auxin response factor 24 n=1 Tax=Olea europaea subsp. europaea TaxID=158383 RepID=A0A8S0QXA4_OLEEU|nr:Auxin response factor 24 [Olea europaea subsp. europaea]